MAAHETADAALSGLASSSRAFEIASERAFNAALDMKISLEIESEARERSSVSDRGEQ